MFFITMQFFTTKVKTNYGKQTIGLAPVKLRNDLPINAKND